MSTIIQTTLGGGTLVDQADSQIEAVRALIKTYIPGMANVQKGILLPGDELIKPPIIMLQARKPRPRMYTTAKFHTDRSIEFVFWVGNDNPEPATVLATNFGQIFEKLFSNNALADIGSTNSNKFKQYQPYWINSEMSGMDYSPAFKFWQEGPKYIVGGGFTLDVQTVQIE